MKHRILGCTFKLAMCTSNPTPRLLPTKYGQIGANGFNSDGAKIPSFIECSPKVGGERGTIFVTKYTLLQIVILILGNSVLWSSRRLLPLHDRR